MVDLPDGPNMIQTHVRVGHPGYVISRAVSTQSGDTLSKSGNPTVQPLKIFQFIIGELRFSFVDDCTFTLDLPKIASLWNKFFS